MVKRDTFRGFGHNFTSIAGLMDTVHAELTVNEFVCFISVKLKTNITFSFHFMTKLFKSIKNKKSKPYKFNLLVI